MESAYVQGLLADEKLNNDRTFKQTVHTIENNIDLKVGCFVGHVANYK